MSKEVQGTVKNLEDYARQVWMLPDIEDKKLIAIEMINQFDQKSKIPYFTSKINQSTDPQKLDTMVMNIAFAGNGLGTI